MTDRRLRDILAPAVVALNPPSLISAKQRAESAIAPDNTVQRDAVDPVLPWQRADLLIPGEAVAMSNAARIAFPQGGAIRHVSISAQTAPSGNYSIDLVAPTDSQSFSLQAGISSRMLPADIDVEANSWVSVNVINAGGAEDVFISIHYTPLGGS